jgi:hypothetical protein
VIQPCFTETAEQPSHNPKLVRTGENAADSNPVHVTFTTRRDTYPLVHVTGIKLLQEEEVKYLGLAPRQKVYLAQNGNTRI